MFFVCWVKAVRVFYKIVCTCGGVIECSDNSGVKVVARAGMQWRRK